MKQATRIAKVDIKRNKLKMLLRIALEDVWHSWLRIAHSTPTSGRFLLEEPESSADAQAEADLTERLRLLYGE